MGNLFAYVSVGPTSSHHYIFGLHLGNALLFLTAPSLWAEWAYQFEKLNHGELNPLAPAFKIVEGMSVASIFLFLAFTALAVQKGSALKRYRSEVALKNDFSTVEQLPFFSQNVKLGHAAAWLQSACPILASGAIALITGQQGGWLFMAVAGFFLSVGFILMSRVRDLATKTKFKEAAEYNADGTEKGHH
jgi:hypothetical protein